MADFAINLETIYPGMSIYEKLERVAAAGFREVEFWSWKDKDLERIRTICSQREIKVRAFSGTASWSLCDRAHREKYIEWIKKSVKAAKELDCDTLILFPNHFTPEGCADFREVYSREGMIANITAALTRLAPFLEENEVTVLLEPLCSVGNDGGMSVTDTSLGADIVRAVDSPRVRLLCDVYHMQMMHGNLLENIVNNMDIVPYIHLADAPDRHEPGTGEINFDYLLGELKARGYDGTICFEYFPKEDTENGFPVLKRICETYQN